MLRRCMTWAREEDTPMFSLFRRKSDDGPPPLDKAIQLAQKGKTVEGEELLLGTLQNAETRHGKDSFKYADAANAVGLYLAQLGQADRALPYFRAACAIPMPNGGEPQKDYLSFLLNLAYALSASGEMDEAEKALRRGLEGREAFYGRDHAGFAFGLEPLAMHLLKRERYAEAQPLFDEVVQNFWKNRHPRISQAIALRAEALKAIEEPMPAFGGLDELPDGVIDEIGQAVISRIEETSPVLLRKVLVDLLPLLEARLGETHQTTLNTLATIANNETLAGEDADYALRETVARRIMTAFEKAGRVDEAVHAAMGLALGQSSAGDNEGAVETYRDAVARVARLGKPALESQVRRNYGLLLAELERKEEAEGEMRQAVTLAQAGKDREMHGRAQVALGIFYQHNARLSEAEPLLAEAIRTLGPAHADSICARSHLHAIQTGGGCGCGDTPDAYLRSFEEYVMSLLPSDLVESVKASVHPEQGLSLSVQVKREIKPEEAQHLNRILEHATAEFRKRITAPH
jgi:tetratricopeptide (TPR) repeat protein